MHHKRPCWFCVSTMNEFGWYLVLFSSHVYTLGALTSPEGIAFLSDPYSGVLRLLYHKAPWFFTSALNFFK